MSSCRKVNRRPHLRNSEVPIWLYSPRKSDKRERDLPIFHLWRVGVKRKNLQFDRVELVDLNRGLRVRVQVLVELFQYGVDSAGVLGI